MGRKKFWGAFICDFLCDILKNFGGGIKMCEEMLSDLQDCVLTGFGEVDR